MRKRVEIEHLLQWVYRDELPKKRVAELCGWDAMSGVAELGARVDDEFPWPGHPVALGPPHPDALSIDYIVRGLEDVSIDWARSRDRLMGNLIGLTSLDDPMLKHMNMSSSALVIMHARMAKRPVWDLGCVQPSPVKGLNGKPIIQFLDGERLVAGRTRDRHYGPSARCPLKWTDPSPREVACARAEYAVWHAALCELVKPICAWNLQEYEASKPAAVPEPWLTGEPKSRILYDISKASGSREKVYAMG